MSDIKIVKRRDRAILMAETLKGELWIKRNVIAPNINNRRLTYTSINSDLLEDFIVNLNEAEITYEVV